MTKYLITTLAILSFAACARTRENPNKPADPQVDSQQVLDQKALAEKQKGDGVDASGAPVAAPTPLLAPNMTSEPAPAAAPVARTAPVVASAPDANDISIQDISKDYNGKNLIMLSGSKDHLATLSIEGKDAEVLFKSMKLSVSTKAGNDVFLAADIKAGQNLKCYSQAMKITPKAPKFSCAVAFNFFTGKAIANEAPLSTEDAKVAKLVKIFTGDAIKLSPAANGKALDGILRLRGEDAQKLYKTLNGTATQIEKTTSMAKVGQNVACIQAVTLDAAKKEVFECVMHVNFESGLALATEKK